MATTAWGRKYAEAIHNGKMSWPEDIPQKRRAETYAAYTEAGYQPPLKPLEQATE